MNKVVLSSVVSGLIALSLVVVACSQGSTTTQTSQNTQTTPVTQTNQTTQITQTTQTTSTKASGDKPKYGGTLVLWVVSDPSRGFDPIPNLNGLHCNLPYQQFMEGDWLKGNAGGYGIKKTDWAYDDNDLYDLKAGFMVESVNWTTDAAKNEGTIVYQVRRGVHWALNPASEASRLVNGREMTADDILYTLQQAMTNSNAYVYKNNPELRNPKIAKTGEWEITLKVPLDALMIAITRTLDSVYVIPKEVYAKYGNMADWKKSVGTGPFMLTEYVAGSTIGLVRNPNYWMTDPAGPGKGNQLPYLDGVKVLIIPDTSTKLAALRTGKVDILSSITKEDARSLKKTAPQLLEYVSTSFQGRGNPPLCMRVDTPPFNDVRVRRAMNMAVDFNAILQGYWGGEGQIYTWPYSYIKEYKDLYLDFNDYPDTAKEIFSYNPEKAKQLLKEAGYPNGFKTSIIILAEEVDFIAIYKDYLSKIGIDMSFTVTETGAKMNIRQAQSHTQMITGDTAPAAIFYNGQQISGPAQNNNSIINDPYINGELVKIRQMAVTDMYKAMAMYREMTKYVIDQAYVIPAVIGSFHTLWWPWVKNYSGELNVGYDDTGYPTFIWYDETLKKSMGH